MQQIESHPYADIFPQMLPDEYEALVADIHQHGQQEAIVLFEGKILDGRHRYQAMNDLQQAQGVDWKPKSWEFCGTPEEAMQFVFSANLYRRHLTTGQRACMGVDVKHQLQETVKQGQRTDLTWGKFAPSGSDERAPHVRDIAGKMLNVSGRSIDKAERIQEEAPDLFERVKSGEMHLSAADNALAVRNGTQTNAQAAAVIADKIVLRLGNEPITEHRIERIEELLTIDNIVEKMENLKTAHVSNNSGVEEWYTPSEFIEAARAVMGHIDLDPASSFFAQVTVKATKYYTVQDDGLLQDWHGTVWMNPPYTSGLIGKFTEKLAAHVVAGDVIEAIVLVNNATETAWFQSLVSVCSAICFPASRVRFLDPDGKPGAPLQGQAILYAGEYPDKFQDAFKPFGFCVEVTR